MLLPLALLSLALAVGAPRPLPAQPRAGAAPLDTAALLGTLRAEMAAMRAPGIAVAVVVGDSIVFERGLGTTSVEGGVAVTPRTLFRIGSTTKMFTGLTALRLAGDGRLRLDRPIGEWVPGLSAPVGRPTLAQLLSHTGGLVNAAAGDGPHDDDALGERVRAWGDERLFVAPGEVYSYSGPGYWLAGHAIERAGGGRFADLVDSLVLAPVGMERSTFRPLRAFTHPVALDHRVDVGGTARVVRPFPDDVTTWASGSLFSSAHELARFVAALLNGGRLDGRQVLPAAAVAALLEPHATIPGTPCSYTFGLQSCTNGGVRTLGHAGFRGGTGSIVSFVPEHRVGVVVLSNRNGGIPQRTERRALELLVPSLAADEEGAAREEERFTSSALARLAGRYANGPDTLHLVRRGRELVYRYGATESATRPGASQDEVLVLGAGGRPVQRFVALPEGANGRARYLHDGLSAFARLP